MTDGGYDDSYHACSCLWGTTPAGMVQEAIDLISVRDKKSAIDLGCGEGKNAAAMSAAGINVVAIDISGIALSNAMESFPGTNVCWLECDIRRLAGPAGYYDLVVATGSLHCLRSEQEVRHVISLMKLLTKDDGANVLSSFNDGPQDFSGHDASFSPTLISHGDYLEMYQDWEILRSSDEIQSDLHPHNSIEHSHSITRILARKPVG